MSFILYYYLYRQEILLNVFFIITEYIVSFIFILVSISISFIYYLGYKGNFERKKKMNFFLKSLLLIYWIDVNLIFGVFTVLLEIDCIH